MIELTLPRDIRITCRAILFDMDGVLVDSLGLIEEHLRDWAHTHGLNAQEVIAAAPGRTNAELIAQFAPWLDVHTEARIMLDREITEIDGIRACPGASELLEQLPATAWAVVTSGHRPVAVNRLKAARLRSPAVLITADDVQAGKPHPQGYLDAARLLGVAPEDCVIFEDADAGLAAATAAGIRAIAVVPPAGRGPALPADHVVPDLSAVHATIVDERADQLLRPQKSPGPNSWTGGSSARGD
ncbi:HAD-IA family hydrolase [Nocardia sp. 004]|uniref:HAD-IA family hydrolase n=1 Tax=Nocardia sp. 004 TaxID=3385978 RepID=UPI0039A0FE4E